MSEDQPSKARVRDLAEDATGFGAAELKMTRDLILRPQAALIGMASGDPAYPRPFRYYLALNALYLLIIAVLGGFARTYERMIPADLARPLADFAGKSVEALYADLDQWYSLTATPILALAFYPPLNWLFGRWTKGRLPASGQAFAFLSGWTLLGLPFGLINVLRPDLQGVFSLAGLVILIVLFHRMGRGLWWTSRAQWAARFLQTGLALAVSIVAAAALALVVSVAGAAFAP